MKNLTTLRKELPKTLVVKRTDYNEYRINFRGASEATAYYTDDYDDALSTGRAMAKEGLKS